MYLNLKSIILSKKLLLLTISTAFLFTESYAQLRENYKADIEVQAIGTTNGTVPFWMRSNQFGSIPLSGASGSLIGRFSKNYSELTPNEEIYGRERLIDWGFGLEARANGGKTSNLQLIQAYVKAKVSIFELKVGRTKDVMGLNGDTTLSSGNFAVSGNALGMPKVEISIPEYWRIPILDGLFSVKGTFSNSWLGQIKVLDSIVVYPRPDRPDSKLVYPIFDNRPETYLHQKSLYVRLGKKNWKMQLYGGFSHQAQWGSERGVYGSNFKLSPLQTFLYVATGRAYGAPGIPTSKIGNQLGSIDLGIEYDFNNFGLMAYRQFFYDVGALSKLANAADGLTGLAITNKNYEQGRTGVQFKKFLVEYFYSKNQAGYPWSTPTKSGDEDYYNNYYYVKGWSYYRQGIGSPLITLREDAKSGQANRDIEYFLNNRVKAIHLGVEGSINSINLVSKITWSRNYGTFGTSKYGSSTGVIRDENNLNIFKPVNQFSFHLQGDIKVKESLTLGCSTAFDLGKLLNNSSGILVSLKKSF